MNDKQIKIRTLQSAFLEHVCWVDLRARYRTLSLRADRAVIKSNGQDQKVVTLKAELQLNNSRIRDIIKLGQHNTELADIKIPDTQVKYQVDLAEDVYFTPAFGKREVRLLGESYARDFQKFIDGYIEKPFYTIENI